MTECRKRIHVTGTYKFKSFILIVAFECFHGYIATLFTMLKKNYGLMFLYLSFVQHIIACEQ